MSSKCTRVDGQKVYKYLGILQLNQSLHTKMKVKITLQYIRSVKKLCRSKLNGENLIGGTKTWAVDVIHYSAGVVDWTMEEMASMDRMTRKILAMNDFAHTRSNVDRKAVFAKEGRGKRIDWNRGVCKEGKKIPVWLVSLSNKHQM